MHAAADIAPEKTAFVLTGGGSLGAVEVGMLRALAIHGVRPDLVVGSSVGAINAAFFAAMPTLGGLECLAIVWRGIRSNQVFPLTKLGGLAALLGGRDHLSDPRSLRALLERTLPVQRFEDTVIPCVIVATDLLGGHEVRISSGSIVQALLASTAVPAIFPPVMLDGRPLVDGMVSSHTPVVAAIAQGAARVVILPTGHSCALPGPPRTAIGLALHSLSLMVSRQVASDVEHYSEHARLIVVPPLCPVAVETHDFSKTAELMDRAEASTHAWLADGGLEGRLVPGTLVPHHHAMVS